MLTTFKKGLHTKQEALPNVAVVYVCVRESAGMCWMDGWMIIISV